jgi:hypothetical protein
VLLEQHQVSTGVVGIAPDRPRLAGACRAAEYGWRDLHRSGCAVSTIALWLAVFLLPTAVFYAALLALRSYRRMAEARHRPPPLEPVERLEARLRRLRAELEATENRPGLPHKNHRVTALRGAYVDALGTACERLGVSTPPGGERARLADIYRAEAALRERGLDVREPAAH